jgi:hypothetical protein
MLFYIKLVMVAVDYCLARLCEWLLYSKEIVFWRHIV